MVTHRPGDGSLWNVELDQFPRHNGQALLDLRSCLKPIHVRQRDPPIETHKP